MDFSGADDSPTMMELPQNQLLLEDEQKMYDIKEPHHNDVLCGRGVTTNRHPGNESFRSLVGLNKEVYVSSTKKQKMALSRSIVEAVRSLDPPGRFLEKHPDSGLWSDIGHKKAVEKTSQALRDGAANLRKQLSEDLGDPDFLNVVFDMDTDMDTSMDSESDARRSIESPKSPRRVTKGKEIEKAKEKGKADKSKASDKSKVLKTKPTVIKKGHRRVNSTPMSGSAGKYFSRERLCESPSSAFSRLYGKNPDVPPSPCSTPLRQPVSHPSSPATWSGRVSYSDSHSSHVAYDHHSPHEPYYYASASSRGQFPARHHHSEYPHTPTDEWREPLYQKQRDSGEPRYPRNTSQEHIKYPLSAPVRGHSSPPPESLSFPPSGPLPPGRHHFSPAGYLSKPPPPEWSPRVVPHRHNSAPLGNYSVPSARWTRSPYSHDTYVLRRGYNASIKDTSSLSLSVPSLGGESNRSQSTRVALAPRSRPMYDGTPPRASPSDLAPDFAPPFPSPRFSREKTNGREEELEQNGQRKRQDDEDTLMPTFRASQASPPGEEKKIDVNEDDNEDNVFYAAVSAEKNQDSPVGVSLKPRPCYSSLEDDEKEKKDWRTKRSLFPQEDSPGKGKGHGCHDAEENQSVEDIDMSPIPFDREDPTTLMELPENILMLPISPFGPNDET